VETLLLAGCLLWVVGVFVGQHRNRNFLIAYLLLAGITGTWHVGVNQYRWQLVPAYLFLLGASLVAAIRLGGGPPRPGPRWRAFLARTLLILALLIVLALPLWLFPEIRYERPTGPYGVGTRTEVWVDSSRAETFTPAPDDRRRLLVQIWYPADPVPGAARVRSHPSPRELARGLASAAPGIPSFLFSSLGRGLTWARAEVPVSGAQRTFPLLLFSHGFGVSRTQYGFAMAELASHGYVVAGIEHSYAAIGTVFPDGEVANVRLEDAKLLQNDSSANAMAAVWAGDGRFVLERMFELVRRDPRQTLTGRIDTTRIGYFGHSFGGAAAANVMAADPRVLAGVNLDGYLAGSAWVNGLDRPFLQVRSDSLDIEAMAEETLKQVGMTRQSLRELLEEWNRRTVSVTRGGGHELSRPRGPGPGAASRHRRVARPSRAAPPAAGGLPRRGRGAVRHLHTGYADDGLGLPPRRRALRRRPHPT